MIKNHKYNHSVDTYIHEKWIKKHNQVIKVNDKAENKVIKKAELKFCWKNIQKSSK